MLTFARTHEMPRATASFPAFAAFFIAACAATCAAAAAAPVAPVAQRPRDTAPDPAHRYAQRADVGAFIDELVREQGFDRRELVRWLSAARYQPKIVAAMDRPLAVPPKWFEYAPSFLSAERIDGGVAFYQRNAAALARAEETYGVPAEIIAAIIGVETFYGRNTGSYRVLDALVTLAFDYPRRGAFFRGELKEFLLLARDQGISPLDARGSFAGAIGLPQFMPGSYRRFAVDFDGDGHADLWSNPTDVIGSVGNFLARHDWAPGQPVLLPAAIDDGARDAILQKLDGGITERRALAAWEEDGVTVDVLPSQLPDATVALLALEDPPADGAPRAAYWIACGNFFVITRYNRSRLYAAAVWHLAEAIRKGLPR